MMAQILIRGGNQVATLRNVRVPEDAVASLQRLGLEPPSTVDALTEALSGPDRGIGSLDSFGALVESQLPNWSAVDAGRLVSTLLSMAALRNAHDYDEADLAETVALAMAERVPDAPVAVLQEFLQKALASPGLRGLSRAVDVSREFDQLFQSARLMTDLRPIFDGQVSDGALGFVITHSLRLDYFADGQVKTTTIALDSEDLAILKSAVERAQAKENVLRETMSGAGVHVFNLLGDDDDS